MNPELEKAQKECSNAFRKFTQASFRLAETTSNEEKEKTLPQWIEAMKQFDTSARKCISVQNPRKE